MEATWLCVPTKRTLQPVGDLSTSTSHDAWRALTSASQRACDLCTAFLPNFGNLLALGSDDLKRVILSRTVKTVWDPNGLASRVPWELEVFFYGRPPSFTALSKTDLETSSQAQTKLHLKLPKPLVLTRPQFKEKPFLAVTLSPYY